MLVSIYMPTHNRVSLLKRAVNSVLNQTYSEIELIICDDGSSDETNDFLNSIEDRRVKVVRNESPMGACYSRNKCILKASGDFITGLDDDDYFLPNRIENFISHHKKTNEEISCTNYLFLTKEKITVGDNKKDIIYFEDLKNRNYIGNQIFINLKKFRDFFIFDENSPAWQDYDLWFRLLEKGNYCRTLSIPTYVMDQSHENLRISTSSKAYKGYKHFINKHKNHLNKINLRNLYFEDLNNRSQPIKLSNLINQPCLSGLKKYIKKNWIKK